jgi:hypothetical protein
MQVEIPTADRPDVHKLMRQEESWCHCATCGSHAIGAPRATFQHETHRPQGAGSAPCPTEIAAVHAFLTCDGHTGGGLPRCSSAYARLASGRLQSTAQGARHELATSSPLGSCHRRSAFFARFGKRDCGPLPGKSIILRGLGPGRVLLDEPNAYATINPITFNRPDGNVSLLMAGFFLNIGGRLIVISAFTGLTSPSDIDWATRGAQLWIRQVQAASGLHPAAPPSRNTVR